MNLLTSESSEQILCRYVNATSLIQIIRIANIPNWYFDRVIFPGESLLFKALLHAQLEIHTCEVASAIQSNTIHCERLRVN